MVKKLAKKMLVKSQKLWMVIKLLHPLELKTNVVLHSTDCTAAQTMKKILVIEDEAQTRDIFLECLEAEGFDAIGAENGRVGLQRIQEAPPDLVICDIRMPELDGYGVLRELRQAPVTAVIPFIFLTAKMAETERLHGLQLGADIYLTKPCTVENLLEAIAKVESLTQRSIHPNNTKSS